MFGLPKLSDEMFPNKYDPLLFNQMFHQQGEMPITSSFGGVPPFASPLEEDYYHMNSAAKLETPTSPKEEKKSDPDSKLPDLTTTPSIPTNYPLSVLCAPLVMAVPTIPVYPNPVNMQPVSLGTLPTIPSQASPRDPLPAF